MGKDPAFLFYFQDFAFGTRRMDRREKGAFIDLMIEQADLFVKGADHRMSEEYIKKVLASDFDVWETLKEKYEKEKNLFWNQPLLNRQKERKGFAESRRNNRLGKKKVSKSYDKHMVNENEDLNEDLNEDKDLFKNIIEDLNKKVNKKYKHTTVSVVKLIKARLKDGFKENDFYLVHTNMCRHWMNTEMATFLRPDTLYTGKFDSYLNYIPPKESKSKGDYL